MKKEQVNVRQLDYAAKVKLRELQTNAKRALVVLYPHSPLLVKAIRRYIRSLERGERWQ
jgi:hypothetical protein